MANSQLARTELGPRRVEQQQTCSAPTFPPQSQYKQGGPQAALASTSRPVGNSRRLRSEGRRSNNNLGSSEHSSLRRGRGEKPGKGSSKKGLPAWRRPECSLRRNDDHCGSSLSSKSRLPEWGSAYILWVHMQDQYNTSEPLVPMLRPVPTRHSLLAFAIPLATGPGTQTGGSQKVEAPDSWEGVASSTPTAAGSLISHHSSGNYGASSSGCQLSRPPNPHQHLQGHGGKESVPQAGVQMEPRPCLRGVGPGWGRLKGDRQGEKEAGGSRRG